MSLSEQAQYIFSQTLEHVSPGTIVPDVVHWDSDENELTIRDKTFPLPENRPVYLIGFGKASASMAAAVESILGNRITDGIVIAPESSSIINRFQVFKGSHPLPDIESLSSSLELVSFMKSIPKDAFVLNLVSGGTSSLFCVPAGNLEVEDIRKLYSLLIESGATIHEINTVRKVFSAVKGGQILKWLSHTTLVDLMISDITDDDPGMIGSGPSVAQSISATTAFQVLKKYGLYQEIPHVARQLLAVEMDSEVRNKDYRTTKDFENHYSFIISSASQLAAKAAEIAKSFGYETELIGSAWSGPIEKLETHLMDLINESSDNPDTSTAIITYGEPTVKVTGSGLGGRNQELALRMAIRLKSHKLPVTFLSAGTDGVDGPTDAAGAIITEKTYNKAKEAGMEPEDFLKENDSYHFFDEAGGHLKPGPTGNNLMDLQITLIGQTPS